MIATIDRQGDLSIETQAFYRKAIRILNQADVPFLVGGAYALAKYTGVVRHTKDLDVFVRAADVGRTLSAPPGTGPS